MYGLPAYSDLAPSLLGGAAGPRGLGWALDGAKGLAAGGAGGSQSPVFFMCLADWASPGSWPGLGNNGGEGEIRTLERLAASTAFELAARIVLKLKSVKTCLGDDAFEPLPFSPLRSTYRVPALP